MIGLWLVGQTSGVAPGGVGVVYAPPAGAEPGGAASGEADERCGVGVYPFSAGGWGAAPTGRMPVPPRAGVALIGELEYGKDGLDGFVPRLWSAAAISDFGFRTSDLGVGERVGASLNRGAASVGLSDRLQFVDRFDAEGVLGRVRVVGFVQRKAHRQDACATLVQSCDDVAAADFPVMFETLSAYLRFQVSAQAEGNGYDDLAGVLAQCDRPSHAVVIAGVAGGDESRASNLESVGVEPGDVCHSVVYDGGAVTREAIEEALGSGQTGVLEGEGVSWLRQAVE